MVSSFVQLVGFLLLVLAAWLLWSAWALVVGGGLLMVVPELARVRRGAR